MRRDFFKTLSWSVYLACSWTWCIGMFLPVLLVRDYGIAGWIVFAIPNIVGAAGMGWVLGRAEVSERLVRQHRLACAGFSAVTLSFHAFFLAWLALRVIPISWCVAAVAGGSAVAFVARGKRTLDLALAWIVLLVSLAVLFRGLSHPHIADRRGLKDATDLIWLAPVCIFGFALCPYLDLTFHEARQANDAVGSKIAFSLGFGLFFLCMIVLTLLYEGDFVHDGNYGSFGPIGLRTWVALHIAAQSGFTWAAHLRVVRRVGLKDLPIWLGAGLMAVLGGILVWSPRFDETAEMHFLMHGGEVIYRIFMAFYGLIFPAYVWICMVRFEKQAEPNHRAGLIWGIAVLGAMPFFWMGFIQEHMVWLVPGLAIVVLAKALSGSGGGSVAAQTV